jgi:hypothetical protein
MTAPVMSFEQRNVQGKTELKLFPDYLEFNFSDSGTPRDGFNAKYDSLPGDFNFRIFRPRNSYILQSIIFAAVLLPLALLSHRGDPVPIIGITVLVCFVLCFFSAGINWLLAKNYTVLPTQGGHILIVQDAQHDRIIDELRARRVAALQKAAVVNRLQNPWSEVKKFKFLRDEGVISDNDFNAYKEMIFVSGNATAVGSGKSPATH